jgi:hypothetical protein
MAHVTITLPQLYRAAIIGTGFMGRIHSHAIVAAGGSVAGIIGSSPPPPSEPRPCSTTWRR